MREVYPHTGNAAVVGFTGPPGVGKSTLIGALTQRAPRGRPHGRGALDRPLLARSPTARCSATASASSEHFLDPGVFIRSMANRGALGGLSEAALQAALLIDAAGRDDVFIETVGVGQAEIDIIDHADTVVLVLMPGSGDSIQALKAGVMEIPDVIVINKADHPLTDTMVREIRGVLSLANLDRVAERAARWRVPIVRTEAAARPGRRRAGASAWTSTARTSSPRAPRGAPPAQPAQRGARDRHRPPAPAPGGGAARGRRVRAAARRGRRAAPRPRERRHGVAGALGTGQVEGRSTTSTGSTAPGAY